MTENEAKAARAPERTRRLPAWARRHPRSAALLVGVVGAVLLLALGEGACFALVAAQQGPAPEREGGATKAFSVKDADLGYKPKPNARMRAVERVAGRCIYDAVYTTDAYSRRVTPLDPPTKRAACALFFGGSYVFGEGVNDNETLPYYFGRFYRRYRPYNYGFSGYGPQQMLARLQSPHFADQVEERRGIAVYVFMRHHVARAIGDMAVYTLWGADMPYYTFDRRGRLVRRGSFRTGRPVVSALYGILGRSYILKFFRVSLPPRITEKHLRLTAAIIEESKSEFERQFESEGFFVVLHPAYRAYSARLARLLRGAGVTCFDYSAWWRWRSEATTFPADGHPNALGHYTVAKRLAEDVREYELRRALR